MVGKSAAKTEPSNPKTATHATRTFFIGTRAPQLRFRRCTQAFVLNGFRIGGRGYPQPPPNQQRQNVFIRCGTNATKSYKLALQLADHRHIDEIRERARVCVPWRCSDAASPKIGRTHARHGYRPTVEDHVHRRRGRAMIEHSAPSVWAFAVARIAAPLPARLPPSPEQLPGMIMTARCAIGVAHGGKCTQSDPTAIGRSRKPRETLC